METKEMETTEETGGGLKVIRILSVCLLVGVLAVGGAYQLFYPKPTYSESEKRDLARMPAFSLERLLSGAYFSDIDTYYSDTFPFREQFVTLAADFNEAKGIVYDGIKIYGEPDQGGEDVLLGEVEEEIPSATETVLPTPTPTLEVSVPPTETAFVVEIPAPEEDAKGEKSPRPTPAVSSAPTPEASASPEESEQPSSTQAVPEEETPNVAPPEKVNNVIIYNNQAFERYGGSESGAKRYAGLISQYQDLMPNATLYNILVPTHAQIGLLPTKYGYLTGDQAPLMQTVFDNLDSRVKAVDILPTLMEHKDEYLYYRTDHHWTAEGAFYAYEVFCNVAGQAAMTRDECTKTEDSGFLGSFYAATKDSRLKKNADTVVAFQISYTTTVTKYNKSGTSSPGYLVSPASTYLSFLGGDNPFMSVTTGNQNGRKLLIVKESYGNVFSTIVAGNYEQIYIADSRYCPFNIVDLVNNYEVDDVIFINNMFAATTGVRINEIEALQSKTAKYSG